MEKWQLEMMMDPRNRGKLPSVAPPSKKEESEEAKQWNQQIKEWSEQEAKQIDFTPQATQLKPLEACRREWIISLCRSASYDQLGAIPLRACKLIQGHIEEVCESKEEAELICKALQEGVEKVAVFIDEEGGDKLFEGAIADIMGLNSEVLDKFYQLALKLYEDKKEREFGDLSLFLLQLNPFVASYHNAVGLYHQMLSDWVEAAFHFEQARQLNPNNPYGYLNGMQAALALNQKGQALSLLDELNAIEGGAELAAIKEQAKRLVSK